MLLRARFFYYRFHGDELPLFDDVIFRHIRYLRCRAADDACYYAIAPAAAPLRCYATIRHIAITLDADFRPPYASHAIA